MTKKDEVRIARKDLSTDALLNVVDQHGFETVDVLRTMGWPYKVIIAAIIRDYLKGYLDFGVAEQPWLTTHGRLYLRSKTTDPIRTGPESP